MPGEIPHQARALLAAIAARCQALVTGDQTHFGPLFGQRVGGVAVDRPPEDVDAFVAMLSIVGG